MKTPSYLRVSLEPWTAKAGPVDFDTEIEKLEAASTKLLAREQPGFTSAAERARVVGAPASSSTESYDRGSGHGAYAVRAGAGLTASGELEPVGPLSPEEKKAVADALKEAKLDEPERGSREFLERAAWRNYKRNRFKARVEADRFRFGEREEHVVARRFDDMYRRHEEDVEFEMYLRRND